MGKGACDAAAGASWMSWAALGNGAWGKWTRLPATPGLERRFQEWQRGGADLALAVGDCPEVADLLAGLAREDAVARLSYVERMLLAPWLAGGVPPLPPHRAAGPWDPYHGGQQLGRKVHVFGEPNVFCLVRCQLAPPAGSAALPPAPLPARALRAAVLPLKCASSAAFAVAGLCYPSCTSFWYLLNTFALAASSTYYHSTIELASSREAVWVRRAGIVDSFGITLMCAYRVVDSELLAVAWALLFCFSPVVKDLTYLAGLCRVAAAIFAHDATKLQLMLAAGVGCSACAFLGYLGYPRQPSVSSWTVASVWVWHVGQALYLWVASHTYCDPAVWPR